MASSTSARAIALSLLTAVLPLTQALRVTPGSPCASACTDSSGLPRTDPHFFDNQWRDIVCEDNDYDSKPKGQKLKSCLGCLQNSNFTQRGENDQDWFLFNLRYTSDFCLFGYPNSQGFNPGPCVTSEACGDLTAPLREGIQDPTHSDPYAYCDANGASISGPSYEKCMECIQADETHFYASNFLVALKGACQEKPTNGSLIPLNATVFSNETIHVIDPATAAAPDGRSRFPPAAIAGITVGAFMLVSLAIGCVFMQIRKHKNREQRRERASVLSFRCRANVSPVNSACHIAYHDNDRFFAEEKLDPVANMGVATNSSAEDEYSQLNSHCPAAAFRRNTAIRPSVITLPPPSPAHISPRRFSPDEYTTPTSTISTRSNDPLLTPHLADSISPVSVGSSSRSPRSSSYSNRSGWPGGTNQPETVWGSQ